MTTRSVPQHIRVFIASPGDLAAERKVFHDVCQDLNKGFGDGAGIRFEPLGWENMLSAVGRRNQSVINQDIDRCDVFVLAIHRRWGQSSPDSAYSSYTEEEFHRALDRLKRTNSPEIFVFFKHIDPGQMADPGPQLQKVLAFRQELEDSREVLYRMFSDASQFRLEVDHHLRRFAKGDIPPRDITPEPLTLPIELREKVTAAHQEVERQVQHAAESRLFAEEALARAEKLALALAERAATDAAEGRMEHARQGFAEATVGTNHLDVLRLASAFYSDTGDLRAAEQLLKRHLEILEDEELLERANVLQRLGTVHCEAREFAQAERRALEALSIYSDLGEERFVAQQEAEIGLIYLGQGKLSESKAALKRAGDKLLALEQIDDFVVLLGNAAVLAAQRGEHSQAEELQWNALKCEEAMRRSKGIARACHNLGLIYLEQEKFKLAEQEFDRALAISEGEGQPDAIMRTCAALALVANKRGHQDKSRQMVQKAREVARTIGREDMEELLDNLGSG